MLSVFRNMFRIPDLRNKILFTLFIFAVYRLGAAIPTPGVDLDAVQQFAEQSATSGFVGLINLFSGGALETLVGVRPGDHALHHGVDHHAAARRWSSPGSRRSRRRATPGAR